MTSYHNAKKNNFVQAIYLDVKGSASEFKLFDNIDIEKIDVNKFPNVVLDNVGKGSISRECDFTYKPVKEEITISIFAFTDGKEKQINKTDLPPPIDNEIYYGNIFVIAHTNDKLINLTLDTYEKFYEHSLGGIEDIGSQDSWSEEEDEENSEDRDFIASEGSVSEELSDSEEEFIDSDDSDEDDTQKLKIDSILDLKECDIIDVYLKKVNKELLKAPVKIKEIIYKHHNKNNQFIEEWFDYHIKNLRGKQSKIYSEYKKIVCNIFTSPSIENDKSL